jgi:hypothetical protein
MSKYHVRKMLKGTTLDMTYRKTLGVSTKPEDPGTCDYGNRKRSTSFQGFGCRRRPSMFPNPLTYDRGLWGPTSFSISPISFAMTHQSISDSDRKDTRELEQLCWPAITSVRIDPTHEIIGYPPFQPYRTGASRQQIEMTQNRRPTIFMVQKLIHKQMHRCTKRIYRKISYIFRKREQGKCSTERKVRKRRLQGW